MTTSEQQAVPVAQIDREAAARLFGKTDWSASQFLTGKRDKDDKVQAFARHRVDATQTREAEGQSFEALERFITDHEGHDETSDGLDVDRRAREALSALRIVVSAALAVCHSGDDDCTNGRVVTIDPDAFDALNAALDRVGEEGDDDRLTGEEAWDVLVNVDDRTSPEEYPDMCLITRDELIGFMSRAALNARGGA